MIVLDPSALVVILRGEPEAGAFLARIVATDRCLLSSVSLLKTSMMLAGRGASRYAWTGLDQLIEAAGIEIVPFSADQAILARKAFIRASARGGMPPLDEADTRDRRRHRSVGVADHQAGHRHTAVRLTCP